MAAFYRIFGDLHALRLPASAEFGRIDPIRIDPIGT
jgi:hypothetical protein